MITVNLVFCWLAVDLTLKKHRTFSNSKGNVLHLGSVCGHDLGL